MKHSQELAKVPAAFKLPCLLSSLYDPEYKEMTEEEFGRVSANVFGRLSMSEEEAAFLEESTHFNQNYSCGLNIE